MSLKDFAYLGGIAAAFAAGTSTGSIFYSYGKDSASSEIASLTKQNQELQKLNGMPNISEFLNKLDLISKEASSRLKEISDINELRNHNKSLSEQLSYLSSKIDHMEKVNSDNIQQLNYWKNAASDKLEDAKEIKLYEYKSEWLLSGRLAIGASSISYNSANISIGKDTFSIKTGETKEFTFDNKNCSVILRDTQIIDTTWIANLSTFCRP
jgi:hypothetical protein